jgi:hypothetical protein
MGVKTPEKIFGIFFRKHDPYLQRTAMWLNIIPISSACSEGDLIRLNHYTNLQPLWEEDNLIKSNNMI